MAVISPSTNQISPAAERMYGLSRLVGEWKGKWSGKNQDVGFKVVNIRGARAQIEYTHNGRTERGIAKVEQGTITFGNVTFGTKDGKTAALVFTSGGGKAAAFLDKQASPADTNPLVGSWGGHSDDTQGTSSFRVLSINGNEAKVKTVINGITREGTGLVYKNVIMFGQAQLSTEDGRNGRIIVQSGLRSFLVPATKYTSADSTSSSGVNKVA
ncbi:hypothetical protein LPW26_10775 [Rhodopseudomonas sp. HC1]|uniref:hypothetical protein n=1 Tax=Rhodopseudomonas infernalis TaxID=2897386 RepID=UPI001EE97FF8|nr:hypothetical protein [Rhodopseudomonas infernalis]MCG6205123.1 hypothetical protein [Rhodopseudomonas infernalis]